MLTQTLTRSSKIHTSEWSPVSAITLVLAQLYASFFRFLHPALADRCGERLEKAVHIMTRAGARRRAGIVGVYEVESESGRGWYTVDTSSKTCTCPDATAHPDLICKHRLAVGLQLVGPDWIREATKRQVHELNLAQINVDAALLHCAECGDVLETFATRQGHGLPVPDLEIELARSANTAAAAEATRLQAVRDQLQATPLYEFA